MYLYIEYCFIGLLFIVIRSNSQSLKNILFSESLSFQLESGESVFLRNNFLLPAQQSNKASKAYVIQANVKLDLPTKEDQVYRALQKAYDNHKLFLNIDPKFTSDFDRLLNEVLINYQKRNLGLLDFLDFYDSYKQNVLQVNYIQFNHVSAFEDLNFYTGTNFFN